MHQLNTKICYNHNNMMQWYIDIFRSQPNSAMVHILQNSKPTYHPRLCNLQSDDQLEPQQVAKVDEQTFRFFCFENLTFIRNLGYPSSCISSYHYLRLYPQTTGISWSGQSQELQRFINQSSWAENSSGALLRHSFFITKMKGPHSGIFSSQ